MMYSAATEFLLQESFSAEWLASSVRFTAQAKATSLWNLLGLFSSQQSQSELLLICLFPAKFPDVQRPFYPVDAVRIVWFLYNPIKKSFSHSQKLVQSPRYCIPAVIAFHGLNSGTILRPLHDLTALLSSFLCYQPPYKDSETHIHAHGEVHTHSCFIPSLFDWNLFLIDSVKKSIPHSYQIWAAMQQFLTSFHLLSVMLIALSFILWLPLHVVTYIFFFWFMTLV